MFQSKSIKTRVGIVSLAMCLMVTLAVADPTTGFTQNPFTFRLQWPYNLPQSARFSFLNGVYHLWVFSNDKPLRPGNTTRPRTEMRFADYTSGAHEYAADLMVPTGTSGTCVYQIHTGDAQSPKFGATQIMLFFEAANGGSLHIYHGQQIASGLYNKYFHLNAIQDTKTHLISIYINGALVYTKKDNGAGDYYMKSGVYGQSDMSKEMQVFIKNPTLWSK